MSVQSSNGKKKKENAKGVQVAEIYIATPPPKLLW